MTQEACKRMLQLMSVHIYLSSEILGKSVNGVYQCDNGKNIEQKHDLQICISKLETGGSETRKIQDPHFCVRSNLTVKIILQDMK